MRMSPKARMNRLFSHGRCLDVAIDHGVCNEPSFMVGLEDIGGVVDQLVAAGPDAIQMNHGQADLLQSRPEKTKPALVMRIYMGNPYNDRRHRMMWAELQRRDEPIIGALEMDAACVVVNLFMLPEEPDLFRQCVANIAATRAACARYGMPLMIEPLVMLPNEAARVPVLVRGGGKEDLRTVLNTSAALLAQGARGLVYGRNIYQHDSPKRVVAALMAMIHRGVSGEEAWEVYQDG